MIELWYETHSFSVDNERGIATGWLPGALSERGQKSAESLGERLRSRGADVLFASDLHRAVETAEIARRVYPVPLYLDQLLRECNYGDLNGHPVEEIDAIQLASIKQPFPNGESYVEVVERTRQFLLGLGQEWDGATVVLIAHSANRWALDFLFNGRTIDDSISTPLDWQPGWTYQLSANWRTRLSEIRIG